MNRRQDKLNTLRSLVNTGSDEIIIFSDSDISQPYGATLRDDPPKGSFFYGDKILTEQECLKVPARLHVFVTHDRGVNNL